MINRSSLIFIAAVSLVAALIIAGLFSNKNTEPTTRPAPDSTTDGNALANSQPAFPSMERPLAPRTNGIPVLSPKGIGQINVVSEGHSQQGIVVQITDRERGSAEHEHWEDLAYTAAYIAITTLQDPPRGLRITLTTNNLDASIEQLTPVVMSVILAAQGKKYPADVLLTDLMAPGGLLINLHRADLMARQAKEYGLRFMTAESTDELISQLTQTPPQAPDTDSSQTETLAQLRVPSGALKQSLHSALSDLNRGKSVARPLPKEWAKNRERLLSRIRQANPRNIVELMDIAVASAEGLQAIRLTEFGAQMLGPFTERIAKRKLRQPKPWEMAWLVLLLESRFNGEKNVIEGTVKIPQGGTAPAFAATKWITAQHKLLTSVNPRIERLLKRIIKPRMKQPKPYPWHDVRHITRVKGKTVEAPTDISAWGGSIYNFYTLWAQIAITRTLDPERNLNVAASGALTVEDEPLLEGLVLAAQSQLKRRYRLLAKAIGKIPGNIQSLVDTGPIHPNVEVHERINALEKALVATGLSQQALILNRYVSNKGQ